MNSHKLPRMAAAFAAAMASLTALSVNFPLGTHIYKGSVLNYRHEVCTSSDKLTVQAVTTNGNVLATCRVTDPSVSSGVNYRLEVPVATESSPKSAAIGDTLRCVVISDGGQTNVSVKSMPPVSAANAISDLNLVSSSSSAFQSAGGTVLVSDDYLADIAMLMEQYGKTAYEPDADWDGDGVTNYSEYRAGTNPFEASDRLRIKEFSRDDDSALLTFEYAGGHLYAVDSSATLTNMTWAAESFRVESKTAERQKTVSVEGNEYEDIGVMTIYLAPAADSPSMFYTIRAE